MDEDFSNVIIQGSNVPITIDLGEGNAAGIEKLSISLFNTRGGQALKEWQLNYGQFSDLITLKLKQEDTAELPGRVVLKMKAKIRGTQDIIFYEDTFFDVIKRRDWGIRL